MLFITNYIDILLIILKLFLNLKESYNHINLSLLSNNRLFF